MTTPRGMFGVGGRSVIVTGGASGIRRAYAEVMAENGARVCILDLDAERLDLVLAELRAKGGEVWGQALDVSDRLRMASAFDEVAEKHGRIDIVFANAGIDAGPGFLSTEGHRTPEGAIEGLVAPLWEPG